MYKILIVEDEEKIVIELKSMLASYGYEVLIPVSFSNIVNFIKAENPHLILLDINLPVHDGFYILREVRSFSEVPVILVTSRDTDMDELVGMNLGADDFITKPYNNHILLARINRLIKRSFEKTESNLLLHQGLELNVSTSMVSFNEASIELSKNECRLLAHLILNKGRIVSRNDMIELLWQSDQFIDDNTLTVNMTRIKKRLAEIGQEDLIKTKRGQGYMIQ